MATQINFVSERRKVLTKLEEQDRKWFQIALKVVIACFVLFLVGLGFRLFFMYQVKQVVDQQQLTRQAILSQEALEKEYTVFAHKLRELSQLYGRREDKQEALLFFNQLFGPDVKVSEINYESDGDEDILSFTLRARSVSVLDEVFTKLNSTAVSDQFNAIQKDTLRRSDDGSYGMKITLILSGE